MKVMTAATTSSNEQRYVVLYTHQKQKKHKVWQDGTAILVGDKLVLKDSSNMTLDTHFLLKQQQDRLVVGDNIEMDRFLVTIEENITMNDAGSNIVLAAPSRADNVKKRLPMKPFVLSESRRNIISKKHSIPVHDNVSRQATSTAKIDHSAVDINSDVSNGGRSMDEMLGLLGDASPSEKIIRDERMSSCLLRKRKLIHQQSSTQEEVSTESESYILKEESILRVHTDKRKRPFASQQRICLSSNISSRLKVTQVVNEDHQDIKSCRIPFKAPSLHRAINQQQHDHCELRVYDPSELNVLYPSSTSLHTDLPNQTVNPTMRSMQLTVEFSSSNEYISGFSRLLREYLNSTTARALKSYHDLCSLVDITRLNSDFGFSGTNGNSATFNLNRPCCSHGPMKLLVVQKDGLNKGRSFFACGGPQAQQCKNAFKWADSYNSTDGSSSRPNLPVMQSPQMFEEFVRQHGVALYCDSSLSRQKSFRSGRELCPTGFVLYLQRKENSSAYNKHDLWAISSDLSFTSKTTILLRSTFYGPFSKGELALEEVPGTSISNNITSMENVYAIRIGDAQHEFSALDNLAKHVNTMPLLLPILHGPIYRNGPKEISHRLHISFVELNSLVNDICYLYSLNSGQEKALRRVAGTFLTSDTMQDSSNQPLVLVQGCFGAGKSYTIAVIAIFLIKLFEANEKAFGSSDESIFDRILISSATNVAVDNILLKLRDLGYDNFTRVGSVSKTNRELLPFFNTSGEAHDPVQKRNQQELREIIRSKECSPVEIKDAKALLDQIKSGISTHRLSRSRIVGVTCAASTFACLDGLSFRLIVLDEVSQMTEPMSLLPIARFRAESLVLVGDIKQLSPTLTGSSRAPVMAPHSCNTVFAGLERTLLQRLEQLGFASVDLCTQYRSHPYISAISNSLFYNDLLIDGVSSSDRSSLFNDGPLAGPLRLFDVPSGVESRQAGGSFLNDAEAKCVVTLIEAILASGVAPKDVGVVCLYRAQMLLVYELLEASSVTKSQIRKIRVATVDAFQGGEKEIIILTCVRTTQVGLGASNLRVNVALSRARRHLFLVAHTRTLLKTTLWDKVIEHFIVFPENAMTDHEFREIWASHVVEGGPIENCKWLGSEDDSHSSNKISELENERSSDDDKRDLHDE